MRAISLLVVLTLPATVFGQKPEPRYEGKSLTYWLERFQKAENDRDREAAERAVVAFGADAAPALPSLMAMLADHSHTYRGQAANMICAMGSAAKGSVPELIKMLEKPLHDPSRVIRILCAIGPDAKDAIPAIECVISDYLAAMKRSEDLDYYLILDRYEFHRLGADIVPVLVSLLKDVDRKVKDTGMNEEDFRMAMNTARELGKLGPAAEAALPLLKAIRPKLKEVASSPTAAPAAPAAPTRQENYLDQTIGEAIQKIDASKK
jgi:hypothetical protein